MKLTKIITENLKKFSIVLILLFAECSLLSAQGWNIQLTQSGSDFISLSTSNNGTAYVLNYYTGTIHKTTNYGLNWILNIATLPIQSNVIKFVNPNTGFYGGYGYVKKTTNGGVNWQNCNLTPYGGLYYDFCFINENAGWVSFLTTAGGDIDWGYIAKTTNCGLNWQEFPVFVYLWPFSVTFLDSLNGYVAGGEDNNSHGIIFKTTTGGNTFEQLGEYSYGIKKVFFVNANTGWVIAGNGVIKKTTNGGANWIAQNSGVTNVQLNSCWFANLQTGYVCGQNGTILYTTNGGTNWIQQYSPITSGLNDISFINSSTGWISSENGNILFTNNGGISGLKNISSNIPDEYYLYQNYPNPFNPTTKIRFDIPPLSPLRRGAESETHRGEGMTCLKIYNILGKEIETLVNEKINPGSYEVTFDGSRYPSGVYFYRLTTDGYNKTMRMVLLK